MTTKTFTKKISLLMLPFLTALLFAVTGCGSDNPGENNPNTENPVTVTISGKVTASGMPLSGATVAISTESGSLSSGTFSIEISSSKAVETSAGTIFPVEVTAANHATGYAKIFYIEGKTEYSTDITLLPITDSIKDYDNIKTGVDIKKLGKKVGKITIPAEALPAGVTKITGDVTYLDPTKPEIAAAPGGDFLALRTGNSDTPITLDSLGMMEFVLKDQDGNPVTTLEGPGAVLEMIVPNGITVSPGDIIPLWWYDTAAGLWEEDGFGEVISKETSDGTELWIRGTVKHFTWWNYDQPIEEHSTFNFSAVDAATNAPLTYNWMVEGITYNGSSPARECDCSGTAQSTFTVKKSTATTTEQVRVYTTIDGVNYYLVENSGSYYLAANAGSAIIFNTPTEQGSCVTGTLSGTSQPLDGGNGIIPITGINLAPQITSITTSAMNVNPGDSLTVNAHITDPENNGIASITWSASSGTITGNDTFPVDGPYDASAEFIAPANGGIISITITVQDSVGSSSSASTQVALASGLVTGRVMQLDPDGGGSIPAPGYTVHIDENNWLDGSMVGYYSDSVITDDDGYYTFENIPSISLYQSYSCDDGQDVCYDTEYFRANVYIEDMAWWDLNFEDYPSGNAVLPDMNID